MIRGANLRRGIQFSNQTYGEVGNCDRSSQTITREAGSVCFSELLLVLLARLRSASTREDLGGKNTRDLKSIHPPQFFVIKCPT